MLYGVLWRENFLRALRLLVSFAPWSIPYICKKTTRSLLIILSLSTPYSLINVVLWSTLSLKKKSIMECLTEWMILRTPLALINLALWSSSKEKFSKSSMSFSRYYAMEHSIHLQKKNNMELINLLSLRTPYSLINVALWSTPS